MADGLLLIVCVCVCVQLTVGETALTISGDWVAGSPLFRASVDGEEVIVQYLGREGATLNLSICGSAVRGGLCVCVRAQSGRRPRVLTGRAHHT